MSSAEAEKGGLTWLDYAALWGFLGASLYIMPFGSLLVPAMSIERAVLAAVFAALIAGLLIGAVSSIAARNRSTTLQLLTNVFGESARGPMSLVLITRHIVFAAFAIALGADSAELVSERALGEGLRPVWIGVFALAGLGLAWLGAEFTIGRIMKRFGISLVVLAAVGITVSAYLEYEIPAYLKRPAAGGWPSFAQGVDLLLIVPLLYLPVVADHARFARSERAASGGSFAGVTLATAWFAVLGIIYLPAVESGDIPGFVVSMGLGLGALVLLLLLQADEAFINLSSVGEALQGVPRRAVLVPSVIAAAALAVPLDLVANEGWFLLLGALFVPLFAVVIAAHLPMAQRATPFAAGIAWAAGFLVYQWISPADLAWWRDVLSNVADGAGVAFPLEEEVSWLGASVASFVASFLLVAVARLVAPLGASRTADAQI